MDLRKKNLHAKLLTPLKLCLGAMSFLALTLGWQQLQLARKDHKISLLLSENEILKKNLLSIDSELLEIKDTASDVRLFQKELIKVMKDIDHSYPITFATAAKSQAKPSCGFSDSLDLDAATVANNAKENMFFLSSSQEKLRYDTANLLGLAVSMRDVLENTPSMIPVSGGHISSDFGPRIDPFTGVMKRHNGIDIAAPVGTPVYASADGRVRRATMDKEFGNVIELEHANGYVTIFGHLNDRFIKKGDFVKRGQKIGTVGKTGRRCSGPHVHYGVSKNGAMQNPQGFLLSPPHNVF